MIYKWKNKKKDRLKCWQTCDISQSTLWGTIELYKYHKHNYVVSFLYLGLPVLFLILLVCPGFLPREQYAHLPLGRLMSSQRTRVWVYCWTGWKSWTTCLFSASEDINKWVISLQCKSKLSIVLMGSSGGCKFAWRFASYKQYSFTAARSMKCHSLRVQCFDFWFRP